MQPNRLFSFIALCASVFIFIFGLGASHSIRADDDKKPISPHVLVITMFGSAAWARYAVDFGLAHEIDAREMEPGWPYGYTGFGPVAPGVKPTRVIGTEVYQLNETLLQKALALTQGLDLTVNDSTGAKAYR